MKIYIFIAFVLILAGIITYLNHWREKRAREKKIDKISNLQPTFNVDFSTIKEEDYNKLELQEIKKVYIQLIDVENKIDKTNQYLDDIKFCVQIITVITVLPFIIKLIGLIMGAELLSSL